MSMCIDKTGRDSLLLEIDQFCARTGQFLNIWIFPCSKKLPMEHCNRFHDLIRPVECNDLAVEINDIGGSPGTLQAGTEGYPASPKRK